VTARRRHTRAADLNNAALTYQYPWLVQRKFYNARRE